jgi:hypothetical protein
MTEIVAWPEARTKLVRRLRKFAVFGFFCLACLPPSTLRLIGAECNPTADPRLICETREINGNIPVTIYHRKRDQDVLPRLKEFFLDWYAAAVGHVPPLERSVALLVGISVYKEGLQPLPPVRNDLTEMRNYLLVDEKFDDVYILQEQGVTRDNVEYLMLGYFNKPSVVGPKDRFLFYYSGHGSRSASGEGHMQFSEAKKDDYVPNAELSVPEAWQEWGNSIKAKEALFMFDGCELGLAPYFKKGTAQEYAKESDSPYFRMMKDDKSRIFFAATRGGELAHADESNSYFTKEFLRVARSGEADYSHVGIMNIFAISEAMQPKLAVLAEEHHYTPYYTRPRVLDESQYPGAFMFFSSKVPRDADSKLNSILNGDTLNKGSENSETFAMIPAFSGTWVLRENKGVNLDDASGTSLDRTSAQLDVYCGLYRGKYPGAELDLWAIKDSLSKYRAEHPEYPDGIPPNVWDWLHIWASEKCLIVETKADDIENLTFDQITQALHGADERSERDYLTENRTYSFRTHTGQFGALRVKTYPNNPEKTLVWKTYLSTVRTSNLKLEDSLNPSSASDPSPQDLLVPDRGGGYHFRVFNMSPDQQNKNSRNC